MKVTTERRNWFHSGVAAVPAASGSVKFTPLAPAMLFQVSAVRRALPLNGEAARAKPVDVLDRRRVDREGLPLRRRHVADDRSARRRPLDKVVDVKCDDAAIAVREANSLDIVEPVRAVRLGIGNAIRRGREVRPVEAGVVDGVAAILVLGDDV